jgi:hypothetical protein
MKIGKVRLILKEIPNCQTSIICIIYREVSLPITIFPINVIYVKISPLLLRSSSNVDVTDSPIIFFKYITFYFLSVTVIKLMKMWVENSSEKLKYIWLNSFNQI